MFVSRLRLWQKRNQQSLPENILIYRDGVSEGQYEIVLTLELPEIRKACKKTYPAPDTKKGLPYISMVVVGKRHHTRFYPTKADEADERSGNTQNGTIVDRGVTEARNWDFFLQAHSSGLGTARPAHYYIILDEIFRRSLVLQKTKKLFEHAADMLKDITHNMYYLFGRATKAVSICPPAYYADMVCEWARCYLSNVFDGSSPAASVSEGTEGQGQGRDQGFQQMGEDVKMHERLRDTMFYI
jgi:eukaryotic translation initiation factor 2C